MDEVMADPERMQYLAMLLFLAGIFFLLLMLPTASEDKTDDDEPFY